ncbi:MAG: hypothetical protein LBK60_03180 [Verrucomicrobiales bacterium]|jgi:hypothetical protein|nr:hypothetical protein [Verrucomicrobiales bacterium]
MKKIKNGSGSRARAKTDGAAASSAAGEEHLERRAGELGNPANVTPALVRHLAEHFTVERIRGKIDELLEATHVTQGGRVIPDNRAREAGLKLLLAYLIGLPVQRQEILTGTVEPLETLERRLRNSPALRQTLTRMLAETPPC